MKLESYGILIGMRPLNERDAVAQVFTQDFGVMVGVMRGAIVAKKNKPLVGQVGAVSWNARLDSQLGTFHWEAERNLAAGLLVRPRALAEMNAAFGLLAVLLPERECYGTLYDDTYIMLNDLNAGNESAYLRWETEFLRELGYALDLTRCSGCGGAKDLNWLSPKTGRAVCDKCAAPYISKLYKLPLNLNTTGRFLDSVCVQQGVDMPICRKILNSI